MKINPWPPAAVDKKRQAFWWWVWTGTAVLASIFFWAIIWHARFYI